MHSPSTTRVDRMVRPVPGAPITGTRCERLQRLPPEVTGASAATQVHAVSFEPAEVSSSARSSRSRLQVPSWRGETAATSLSRRLCPTRHAPEQPTAPLRDETLVAVCLLLDPTRASELLAQLSRPTAVASGKGFLDGLAAPMPAGAVTSRTEEVVHWPARLRALACRWLPRNAKDEVLEAPAAAEFHDSGATVHPALAGWLRRRLAASSCSAIAAAGGRR